MKNDFPKRDNLGIVCSYIGDCADYPHRCGSCKHNQGKKSHYEPSKKWMEWKTGEEK